MLYCPECLCAGDPEVIFHVPVPLKLGVSNGKCSLSEAVLTRLASVEHIYVRAEETCRYIHLSDMSHYTAVLSA